MEQQPIPFWAIHTFRRPLQTLHFQQPQQQQGQPLRQKNHRQNWVGEINIQIVTRDVIGETEHGTLFI